MAISIKDLPKAPLPLTGNEMIEVEGKHSMRASIADLARSAIDLTDMYLTLSPPSDTLGNARQLLASGGLRLSKDTGPKGNITLSMAPLPAGTVQGRRLGKGQGEPQALHGSDLIDILDEADLLFNHMGLTESLIVGEEATLLIADDFIQAHVRGKEVSTLCLNPSGGAVLLSRTVETTSAKAGGLRVKNEKTGKGFERVITESDFKWLVGRVDALMFSLNKANEQIKVLEAGNVPILETCPEAATNTVNFSKAYSSLIIQKMDISTPTPYVLGVELNSVTSKSPLEIQIRAHTDTFVNAYIFNPVGKLVHTYKNRNICDSPARHRFPVPDSGTYMVVVTPVTVTGGSYDGFIRVMTEGVVEDRREPEVEVSRSALLDFLPAFGSVVYVGSFESARSDTIERAFTCPEVYTFEIDISSAACASPLKVSIDSIQDLNLYIFNLMGKLLYTVTGMNCNHPHTIPGHLLATSRYSFVFQQAEHPNTPEKCQLQLKLLEADVVCPLLLSRPFPSGQHLTDIGTVCLDIPKGSCDARAYQLECLDQEKTIKLEIIPGAVCKGRLNIAVWFPGSIGQPDLLTSNPKLEFTTVDSAGTDGIYTIALSATHTSSEFSDDTELSYEIVE